MAPYVSCQYAPPDATGMDAETKQGENARITCIDDQGRTWWLTEDSEAGDWLEFIARGGQIEAAPEPPPPPRAMVPKSVVQARIIDAGKMDAAFAALMANPTYFARWFAPDRPEVYCDDPDAVGLVMALGLDPAVILAP